MKTKLIPFAVFALMLPAARADEKPPVNDKPLDASFLRLYAETRGFMLGRPAKPKPTPDGKAVLFLRSEPKKPKVSLFEFDVATGKTKELLTPEALLKGAEEHLTPEEKARRERQRVSVGGFSDYQLTEDGTKILLSLSGKLYVYDRAASKATELATGKGTLLDPQFSRDGSKIAYVLDHDVFVYDLATNKESAVTKGGSEVKTHGLAEFVAQEEMSRFSGFWWSPDGKHIAYEEADHTGVEQWFVADPTKPDQKPLPQYYPRPGKKNVAVRLGIVPVGGGETVWVDWDVKKYEYLAAVRWDKELPLTIQVQDRKQQQLMLLKVDPATGKTRKLLEEKDSAWINLRPLVPLPGYFSVGNSRSFVWLGSGKHEGDVQLSLDDDDLSEVLVPSEAGVSELVATISVPFTTSLIYKASTDPTQQHVYLRSIGGTDRNPVPLSTKAGVHSAIFPKSDRIYVMTSTSLDSMPQAIVHKPDRAKIAPLLSVAIEPGFVPNVTIEKIGDGEGFYTAVIRPHGFDPKKKYPVVLDVYGGPHHLSVTQAMRTWLLPQWLADQGFIVVAIDNRGTPGRGRDWERAIYQKFATVPLEDQIKGLKALGAKHPEMDLDRVGIVGWSFGGYMSALAVLKAPDVFKAAVAGAPVTDWEDYDTHYTERYLGLLPESQKAYDEANLVKMADKLTRPLLLVHGTADDNVYFRHTLKLTDALFRAGKDFEVLPLPSLTHMVPDPVVTERLWTRIAGHFQKHLGKAK
jgi:dipeptidyl-peptidase-4